MPLVAREPDPAGAQPFGGYGDWERWPGINCFGGRGGAVMPEADPAPQAMSLKECMDLCVETSGCGGVQVQDGGGGCWLRTEVDVQDCWDSAPWIMYTPPSRVGASFFVSSTRSPAALWILIIEILLVVIIIALLVYYLKKKALCCFKAAPKKEEAVVLVQEEDRQAFKEMDLDGDGVITPEELAQYRQERQCGRNCTNMCAGGKNDKEDDKDNKAVVTIKVEEKPKEKPKPKEPEGHWEYVKDHH